jgi:DNA-binding transcriptional ArsR family regulator
MSQPLPLGQGRAKELAEARELRTFLRTVGDLVRLQVLRQLAQNEEMSVTALAQALRVSQPLLSWHLGVLRRIGLVTMRREGRLAWYSLNRQALSRFCERLDTWVEGGQRPSTVEENERHV